MTKANETKTNGAKTMHTVLLFWEQVPESSDFYMLSLDDADFEKLSKCHGKQINVDDFDDGLDEWLSEFVEKHAAEKLDAASPFVISGGVTVIKAGFYL